MSFLQSVLCLRRSRRRRLLSPGFAGHVARGPRPKRFHRSLVHGVERLEDRRVLALFIDVGTHVLLPDTPDQVIDFYVTGEPREIVGMKFFVQIADGGPEMGGLIEGPSISDLDLIEDPQLLFHDNNDGERNPEDSFWPQWETRWLKTLGDSRILATGMVAKATIDTRGFLRDPQSTWQFDLIVDGPLTDTLFNVDTYPYKYYPTTTNGSIILNNPPVAAAGGAYSVPEGGSILLNGAGSQDPDLTTGDFLTYAWDFDYNGIDFAVDATGVSPAFSAAGFDGPDSRMIGLRVTDSHGSSSIDAASMAIVNAPPIVAAELPLVTVVAGQTANNSGVYSDPGGDSVSLSASIGTLTQSAGTWNWTLPTSAEHHQTVTITATDSDGAAANTTFDLAVIQPATSMKVTALTSTATGFSVEFSHPFVASALNLYQGQGAASGAADVELRHVAGSVVSGSLVIHEGLQKATFVKTGSPLAVGAYTLLLRSGADGFQDASGGLLDGNGDGVAGDAYTATFTVSDPPQGSVVVGIPDFARGPSQPVNLAASTTTGVPLFLSDGAGLRTIDLRLVYDPSLLEITGVSVGEGMPGGAQIELTPEAPGVVRLQFQTLTPLPSGPAVFANLVARVPDSAPYTAKHLLDLREISLNSGQLPAIDDDALHVVAYLGDATGNGTYSSLDTSRVSRIVVGLDSGFSSYPLADPRLVGDITGNNAISSLDTSRVSRVVVGLPVGEVPPLLNPPTAIVISGPDPRLSIPRMLYAVPGQRLSIPVEIDSVANLTGSELFAVDLVLRFDPAVLSVNSVAMADVIAASPAAGWNGATANIDNASGQVIVGISNTSGLGGKFSGSLITLDVSVKAEAAAGDVAINLAATSTSPAATTSINEGGLTILPAPSNASDDGIDGLLTIVTRHPCDVDGDGQVKPLDALILINEINARTDAGTSPDQPLPPGSSHMDVTGDGRLTPLDVLRVINYLNDASAAASVTMQTLGGIEGEAPTKTGNPEGEAPGDPWQRLVRPPTGQRKVLWTPTGTCRPASGDGALEDEALTALTTRDGELEDILAVLAGLEPGIAIP